MSNLRDVEQITNILKLHGAFPFYNFLNSFNLVERHEPIYNFYSIFATLCIQSYTVYFSYHLIAFEGGIHPFLINADTTSAFNQILEKVLCAITVSITSLLLACNFQGQLEILNNILGINEIIFIKFKDKPVYEKSHNLWITYILFLAFLIVFTLRFVCRVSTFYHWALIYVPYLLQSLLCGSYSTYFVCLTRIITAQLKYLKELIKSVSDGRRHLEPTELFEILLIHKKCEKVIDMMNELNGPFLLLHMAYLFYSLTNEVYILCNTFDTEGFLLRNSSAIVWSICFTWILSELCFSCGTAGDEANKTAQILSRVYGKGKEYQNIIDKFLTKSIHQEIKFTAYGFVVIDSSTLFKIVSAVTTYLVILIQFKQLEDSKAS